MASPECLKEKRIPGKGGQVVKMDRFRFGHVFNAFLLFLASYFVLVLVKIAGH
jgi:hypothetical protein